MGAEEAREIEPHANAVAALHVPETGIIDYGDVCRELVREIVKHGGEVRLGTSVTGIHREQNGVVVETNYGDIEADFLINCGGLQSDRLARMSGVNPDVRIIPFRGDYYKLKPHARHLCKGLIYPVPDPAFPFLGVHFTRMIGGEVECGPNAVLSLAREGYGRTSFNLRDALSTATWPGLHRLIAKHWRMGLGELLRSWSKQRFTRSLQRLVPEITSSDIETATAGNRAQALAKDGGLVDDFLIEHIGSCTHVINAPSPAATASLAIAEKIVAEVGITSKPTSILMEHSE